MTDLAKIRNLRLENSRDETGEKVRLRFDYGEGRSRLGDTMSKDHATHLIEMLLWSTSSCAKPRFHSMTLRFFGHTENKHQLITPKETAIVKYGIRPGMTVRFRFDGVERTGVVNRINKRATVLVEDRKGQRYSNGKHYIKFYVPVQLLESVD